MVEKNASENRIRKAYTDRRNRKTSQYNEHNQLLRHHVKLASVVENTESIYK